MAIRSNNCFLIIIISTCLALEELRMQPESSERDLLIQPKQQATRNTSITTMKIFATIITAALVYTSHAWMPLQTFQKIAAAASFSAALSTAPFIAHAAVDFTGSYADPFHPNCQRVVTVQGAAATLSGTDGNPGCPADGSGKAWKLTGNIDGSTIFVDFSPKGGPPALKGIWDDAAPAGIKWPDGNKWTIKN